MAYGRTPQELREESGQQEEQEREERCRQIERSIVKKFRKEIWRSFTPTRAVNAAEA